VTDKKTAVPQDTRSLPVVWLASPLTARGTICFINVRPEMTLGRWVCDECWTRVQRAQFARHIHKEHS
jgi:hypothetical protein